MSKKIPTPAEMKAAVEAFKNKFTKGFYHASPSNKIESFDPYHEASELGSSTMGGQKTANATFLTRDPPFANSFLPAGNARGYKPGSTIYPVSANLGKHFDYETPEGLQVIKEYLSKTYPVPKEEKLLQQWMRDRGLAQRDLKEGSWAAIEDPAFQQHLRDTSHDSFALQEAGRKNVGIFNPANIRGKFAEYNPAEAANPDFMKAEGGFVEGYAGGGKVGMLAELMQLIKNQGGTAAAQRLEKAADLIPNLENKFQPQALKSAFTGDNASAVMVMPPSHFQNYAQQLTTGLDKNNIEQLKKIAQQGKFESIPWLELNQNTRDIFPKITGHEGRHRSAALAELGDKSSLVQMFPRADLRESFPRRSQEEYLEALTQKIGPKPLVRPEPIFNPETDEKISRGLIDLPEMFSAGGNVIKKALEHARKLPFVHYSTAPNISYLEPKMYGSGIKGAEAARLKDAPDIKPRSYFYVDRGADTMRPEQGLGPHKYSGMAEDIYPLHDDPAGFSAIAKQKALDPYMMQFGREVVDQPKHLNELERLIKAAGYKGYSNDDVGLLFHPTPVIKAE